MERRRIFSIITAFCYLFFIAVGFFFSYLMGKTITGNDAELGVAGPIIVLILGVLMGVGAIYAVIGIVPLILKVLHIFIDKKIFPIICLIFDAFYVFLNVALFRGSLVTVRAEGGFIAAVIFGVFLLISLASFALNILSMRD